MFFKAPVLLLLMSPRKSHHLQQLLSSPGKARQSRQKTATGNSCRLKLFLWFSSSGWTDFVCFSRKKWMGEAQVTLCVLYQKSWHISSLFKKKKEEKNKAAESIYQSLRSAILFITAFSGASGCICNRAWLHSRPPRPDDSWRKPLPEMWHDGDS